jgi:hypothetical protein
MVQAGKKYKTVGGWEALVIYVSEKFGCFYAIHKPNTPDESMAITHKLNGDAMPVFAIGQPPRFNKLEPADILINEEIQ